MIQFTQEPQINGQYIDGRFRYNVPVLLKGEVLVPEEWPSHTLDEALLIVDQRADQFNQEEIAQKLSPSERLNVGYWINPDTNMVTTYYQTKWPGYVPPGE